MLYRALLLITVVLAAVVLVFNSVPAVIAAATLAVFTAVAKGLE